jgi:hypothetical protein
MGRQFEDWSSDYRLFSKSVWNALVIEHQILRRTAPHLKPGDPLLVALDDSSAPKNGQHIPATGYYVDPMSPPFMRSVRWAHRFLCISSILTPYGPLGPARGIPIRWDHAPAVRKPRKDAPPEAHEEYERVRKNWTVTSQAAEQLQILRAEMDAIPELRSRLLAVTADGAYCNTTVIGALPERTVLIARVRKDISICSPPPESHTGLPGRPREYGDPLPTPDQIRKDQGYEWKTTKVFAYGRTRTIRYKDVGPIQWPAIGSDRRLRLVIIAPMRKPCKPGHKQTYTDPVCLLISDADYPVLTAIQQYFYRWEIEVDHRDMKETLGVADPQVRNPLSTARQPPFSAMLYSSLILASLDAYGPDRTSDYIPYPKWRNHPSSRPSALDLVALLRQQVMVRELASFVQSVGVSGGSFRDTKRQKISEQAQRFFDHWSELGIPPPLASRILCCSA